MLFCSTFLAYVQNFAKNTGLRLDQEYLGWIANSISMQHPRDEEQNGPSDVIPALFLSKAADGGELVGLNAYEISKRTKGTSGNIPLCILGSPELSKLLCSEHAKNPANWYQEIWCMFKAPHFLIIEVEDYSKVKKESESPLIKQEEKLIYGVKFEINWRKQFFEVLPIFFGSKYSQAQDKRVSFVKTSIIRCS